MEGWPWGLSFCFKSGELYRAVWREPGACRAGEMFDNGRFNVDMAMCPYLGLHTRFETV